LSDNAQPSRKSLWLSALGRLDTGERDVILWRHFEDLSVCDMAQLLQIPEAAASKRYVQAVERLRLIPAESGLH